MGSACDIGVGVPTLMLPKNRRRGSVAASSNLWVQFYSRNVLTRMSSIDLLFKCTNLDFGMIWRYAIPHKTVRCPEAIIEMDFEGRRVGARLR